MQKSLLFMIMASLFNALNYARLTYNTLATNGNEQAHHYFFLTTFVYATCLCVFVGIRVLIWKQDRKNSRDSSSS